MVRRDIVHLAGGLTAQAVASAGGLSGQLVNAPAKPADAVPTFMRAAAGPGTEIIMTTDLPLVYRKGVIPQYRANTTPVASDAEAVFTETPTKWHITFDLAITPGTDSITVKQRDKAFRTSGNAGGGYVAAGTYPVAVFAG